MPCRRQSGTGLLSEQNSTERRLPDSRTRKEYIHVCAGLAPTVHKVLGPVPCHSHVVLVRISLSIGLAVEWYMHVDIHTLP